MRKVNLALNLFRSWSVLSTPPSNVFHPIMLRPRNQVHILGLPWSAQRLPNCRGTSSSHIRYLDWLVRCSPSFAHRSHVPRWILHILYSQRSFRPFHSSVAVAVAVARTRLSLLPSAVHPSAHPVWRGVCYPCLWIHIVCSLHRAQCPSYLKSSLIISRANWNEAEDGSSLPRLTTLRQVA